MRCTWHPILNVLLSTTVAVVVVGAHHALTATEPLPGGVPVPSADGRRLADLERRLKGIEGAEPARLRGLFGTEALVERLGRIEDRLDALERGAPGGRGPRLDPDTEVAVTAPASAPTVENGEAVEEQASPLTEDQERRVRDLAAGVLQGREQLRAAGAVHRALEELGLELTSERGQQVEEALAAHRDRVHRTLEAARAEGLPPDEARGRVGQLDGQLREALGTVLPASEADSLTRVLSTPPGSRAGSGTANRPVGEAPLR